MAPLHGATNDLKALDLTPLHRATSDHVEALDLTPLHRSTSDHFEALDLTPLYRATGDPVEAWIKPPEEMKQLLAPSNPIIPKNHRSRSIPE